MKSKNNLIKLASILPGLAMAYSTNAKSVSPPKVKKTNVLMIYTDDHRYTGVHALGKMQVKTPNIDELVDHGISFSNAFLMGAFSGATCMPSRAMLLTGKQLFQLKERGHFIPKEDTTMGEAFHNAGYESHMVGKWHQDGASLARSFDSGGRVMGMGVYLQDHYRMPFWDWNKEGKFGKQDAYLLQYDKEGKVFRRALTKDDVRGPIGTEKTGPHDSKIFADDAISFIDQYHKKKPFFMYLAFHAPHDPRQCPKKYNDMYPVDQIQLPPSYLPVHPFDNGHMYLRDEELAPWPRTPEVIRQQLSDYYAFITFLDAQIGRVIQALKESGEYDNTLIILSGDSGLAVGCHGLMGKQNVYDEDGIHVPFILSGKLVPDHGRVIDAFCYIHDIFPTICDMAGIPIPNSVTGKSMVPVIKGETNQVRDYTYHAYLQYQRAYRKGDFKLIEYVKAPDSDNKGNVEIRGSRVTQLFNIKKDKWEINNLSFLPQYKDLIKTMQTEMKEKAVELGDNKENAGIKYDFWDYYN